MLSKQTKNKTEIKSKIKKNPIEINPSEVRNKSFVEQLSPVFKPNQVQASDMQSNGFLLSDNEIERAKDYFTKNSEKMRLPKSKSSFPCTVIQFEEDKNQDLYAIYSGKDNKALGKGGFGKVKLMQNLRTREWFAVKVQAIPKLDTDTSDVYTNESNQHQYDFFLQNLKNEKFFLDKADQLIGSLYRLRENSPTKKEEKQFILAMKLAPGIELFEYIFCNIEKLEPTKRLSIAISILEAVKKLHDRSILHCDLKPENLLYDPIKNITTVVDFGTASKLDEGKDKIKLGILKGTSHYMAPEVICWNTIDFDFSYRGDMFIYDSTYSKESDLFALGKTLRWLFGESMLQSKMDQDDPYKEDPDIKAVLNYIDTKMCAEYSKDRDNIEESINYFKTLLRQHLPTHRFNAIKVESINNDEILSSRSDLKEKDHKNSDGVILINKTPNKIHNNFFKRIFFKLGKNKKNTQMISVYETNDINPTEAAINFHQKNNDANNIPLYVKENKTSGILNNKISSKERNILDQSLSETSKETSKEYKNNKESKNIILNFIKKIILSVNKESEKIKINETLISADKKLTELRYQQSCRPEPLISDKKFVQKKYEKPYKKPSKRVGGFKGIPKNIRLFFNKKAPYDQQYKPNHKNDYSLLRKKRK